MLEATVIMRTTKQGDLLIDIPPHVVQSLGFPHGIRWAFDGEKITAMPTRNRMSNRQIKKFKARHGLGDVA